MNLRKAAHDFWADATSAAQPGQTVVPREMTPDMAVMIGETLLEAQSLLDLSFEKEGRESLQEIASLIVSAMLTQNPMLKLQVAMSPEIPSLLATLFAIGYGLREHDQRAAAQFENLLLGGRHETFD